MSAPTSTGKRPAALRRRPRLRGGADPALVVVYTLLVILTVIVAIAAPSFRSSDSILGVAKQSAVLSIVAIGEFTVILGGGIDLSVGSVAKLSALLSASVMAGRDDRILPALAVAVGVGLAVGVVNAIVITKLRVAPFVATFASYYMVRGIAFTYSTGTVGQTSPSLYDFYSTQWFGIDAINLLLLILWIVTAWAFNRLVVARHLYALGGNEDAARLAGVRVDTLRASTYIMCSVLAALAGMFELLRDGVGGPTIGDGLELTAITAVVVGGAALTGGRGKAWGVLGGVLLLQMITSTFDYLQINSLYQQLVNGLIILAAVALYRQRKVVP
jgi:ribose transport system permease protein